MAKRTWVIADTHFFHDRVREKGHRPLNFEDLIVTNWDRLVSPDDLVFHLGDVHLGTSKAGEAIIRARPGIKVLCRGNHDARAEWWMDKGFHFACRYFVLHGVCYSHMPIVPLPPGVRFNIHGHFHKPGERRALVWEQHPYYVEHRERYILVSIEQTLAPVRLEDVLPHEKRAALPPLVDLIDPEADPE